MFSILVTTAKYIFFSSLCKTFTKTLQAVKHTLAFLIEILQSIFSNYNGIKWEINSTKRERKSPNLKELHNIPQINKRDKEASREIINYFELTKNNNTSYQKCCDASRAILRGKLHVYIRKWKISKIINLNYHLSTLEREKQFKLKTTRRNKVQSRNQWNWKSSFSTEKIMN